ncbi:5,10-methylenetetrahydrofolate reductase isoform X1 [Papilio machaon]|uniref:5,10-methylenetetrahydrofolate reductase isoform X1 n=1 Tax=Papilio machaon TaxID=76193 RepID=UPI001E6651A6|nr:5,10-methylenetetrahydrofolate reductase isoform X1 [Papilio machaon]
MSDLLRISDLIRNKHSFTFSFEVTPDVGEAELDKITLQPEFYSITWHALSHQCKDLNIAPLKLANLLRQKNKHVLLNLSCNLMTKAYLNDLLPWLQEKGICNLFIVLGDSFNPNRSDFKTSSEMISYIKAKTLDYFCIGVAGFPYDDCKITALKEKIDLGADFVISQAFFEANIYKNYLEKCKDAKIDVPIIPGIFPFQSQKELDMFLKLCKVEVTDEFKMKLEGENVMDIIENLVLDLHNNLNVKHFHFFTINKLGITCDLVKKIQLSL